jgi:hypothetical protein
VSVTWIDAPGSALANKDDPVDFTTSATPPATFLSVSFGASKPEEIAYRDGAFIAPYTASTRAGNTFSLKRSGGWPSAPTVYVEEPPPPPEVPVIPTSGQSWGTLYEIDLTAQPEIDMSVAGPHTLDGHTWWSKGTGIRGVGGLTRIVAGQGMFLAGGGYAVSSGYAYQIPWLPFAQFADFNPAAPVTVSFRFITSMAMSDTNFMVGGMGSMANSSAALATGERSSEQTIRFDSTPGSFLNHQSGSIGAGINPVGITPASATTGDHLFSVCRLHARIYGSIHCAWSAATTFDPFTATSGVFAMQNDNAPSNPGFYATRNQSSTFSGYLAYLRIMQPMVSP